MRTAEDLNRISYLVIGAAIRVHKRLGPGCFESAYSPCLAYELGKCGLQFDRKVKLTLRYEAVVVDNAYELDFLIEGCVIGELKAVEATAPLHVRQLQTYLRITGYPLGLLINFGARTIEEGTTRQVNNFPFGTSPYSDEPKPRRA